MKLKKNTFIQGAFIATLGIVISKILGIIYVIPFRAFVGKQGGALYGYAYSIYSIFLAISQAGVPLAMSRLISEYNTLGQYANKEKIFKVGRKFLNILGIISFIILFVFAPQISSVIKGGVEGGNSTEDIVLVIRLISFAVLIVPILSVSRGYLQGHRYITPTSISQVIEQIVRVTIIVVGSFVCARVLHLPLSVSVGCSVAAATIGAVSSYIYLKIKMVKNKKELNVVLDNDKATLSTKEIMKMILIYALPLILIELFRSIFNSVDVFMLVKNLVNNFGFAAEEAEYVLSIVTTWGSKLNNIIVSIVAGLMTSLIPNLTRSIVKNDKADISLKINQTFEIILGISLPMTIGLSFLAPLVWNVFYGLGVDDLGPIAYQLLVFNAFATCLFSASMTVAQLMKEYKLVVIGLISGFLFKVLLNVPMMYLFNALGIYPFYGSISTSILAFILTSSFVMFYVVKKYKINIKPAIKVFGNILLGLFLMLLVMSVMKIIIPFRYNDRLLSLLIVVIYSLVGGSVYLFYMYISRTINKIFGKENVDRIMNKLKRH